jgi:hypothetical protein
VFEATFIADGTFVAIDVIEKQDDGYRLTERRFVTTFLDCWGAEGQGSGKRGRARRREPY